MPDHRAGSPAAHGSPPLPDGHVVPQPPRPIQPPISRRQYAYGLICAAVVLIALVIGIVR